ncbi:MAG: alpha/beta fold hydrolase [Myxococcaceae bacterium]|nr:alpha/beta fold hydrolase [Myxococcaceae bacterium]
MSSRQWAHLAGRLAPAFRVTCPDLLGHGANPRWPADLPFHWEKDAEALGEVLASLGEPAHLVGHSYGGLLALALARAHPGRVLSLALVEPVAFGVLRGTQFDPERLAADRVPERGPVLPAEKTAAWLTWFVDYWNGPGAFATLPPRMREAFVAAAPVIYGEVTTLLGDPTPASEWAQLTVPTLLVRGERSPVEAREICAVLAGALPNANLADVAGAGHLSPLTHADAVSGLIEAHLAKLR